GREKSFLQVDAALKGEVHRQERDVGAHVGEAEAFVEFDAVDDGGLARGVDVNMLEPQVAVAVADASGLDALFEQRAVSLQEAELSGLDFALLGLRDQLGQQLMRLREVLLHVAADALDAPELADLRAARRLTMEVRQHLREALELLVAEPSSGEAYVGSS